MNRKLAHLDGCTPVAGCDMGQQDRVVGGRVGLAAAGEHGVEHELRFLALGACSGHSTVSALAGMSPPPQEAMCAINDKRTDDI